MNTKGETEVAVLLADISGSTALYEKVGNAEALRRVSACLDLLCEVIHRRGGRFVLSKGDDVLCTFQDGQLALDAGIEMLELIRDGDLSVHVGVGFGPVLHTKDDVFGNSVDTASRLASLAKSGEILCSEALYDQLSSTGKSSLKFFDERQLKGNTKLANVYQYSDTGLEDATEFSFVDNSGKTDRISAHPVGDNVTAHLQFGEQTYVCTREKPVSMGRSVSCNLVIAQPWISRSHALLEIREDKVYLTDQSASGTYICFDGQAPILARRETVLLHGSCSISLAKHPTADRGESIVCAIKAAHRSD